MTLVNANAVVIMAKVEMEIEDDAKQREGIKELEIFLNKLFNFREK